MKTAMIGDLVEANLEFNVDRIDRENGLVCVAGRVKLESGKTIWVNVPLEHCEEAVEIGNGGEEIRNVDPEDRRGL